MSDNLKIEMDVNNIVAIGVNIVFNKNALRKKITSIILNHDNRIYHDFTGESPENVADRILEVITNHDRIT